MSKIINEMDSKFTELSVLVEQIKVLTDDVLDTYLEENIESKKDFWKLGEPWRTNARVKMQIASGILGDLRNEIDTLQSKLEGFDGKTVATSAPDEDVDLESDEDTVFLNREAKIDELMDVHQYDRDVAEAMLDLMLEDGELDPAEYCAEGILNV